MPGSREEDFYRTYGHTLHKTAAPGVMKVTILVDPYLVIITTYLYCLIYAWE